VLATGPKVRGFKPRLRTIKIRSTTSLRVVVMPSVPCHKVLWHVKDPYSVKEVLNLWEKFTDLSCKFLLLHYQVSLLVTARELWWVNREWLKLRWGSTIDQLWSQCMGRLVQYHPVSSNSNRCAQTVRFHLTVGLLECSTWGYASRCQCYGNRLPPSSALNM
jgi:hypothetical protein